MRIALYATRDSVKHPTLRGGADIVLILDCTEDEDGVRLAAVHDMATARKVVAACWPDAQLEE